MRACGSARSETLGEWGRVDAPSIDATIWSKPVADASGARGPGVVPAGAWLGLAKRRRAEETGGMAELVTVHVDGDVTTITLDNPAKRNALSAAMMRELRDVFTAVGQTQTLAVVLAASGPVFSAGHDLAELVGVDLMAARAIFGTCVEMVEALHAMPQPVVARVQGAAAAAGCQLVASCDLAVAAESAAFSLPGTKRGLFCHTPLVAVERLIGPRRALEMALTGDPVDAATAAAWGLVNQVVPDPTLDEAVKSLVQRILDAGSPYARGLGKQTFYAQIGLSERQAYELAGEVVAMNAVLPDAQEGFTSFTQKRQPVFRMPPNVPSR